MHCSLTRIAYLQSCTLGWLFAGALKLATIERPWIPNPLGLGGKRLASCVPDGTYVLSPYSSAKFPEAYSLVNHSLGVHLRPLDLPMDTTWGRHSILIHAGNRVGDVVGCIAVGESHGMMGGELAVLASQRAMIKLRQELGATGSHRLVIEPTRGTVELVA